MNGILNERMAELKNRIHALWARIHKDIPETELADSDYQRNDEEDMPLTLAREDGPGVRYYTTENNPLARGASKIEAGGIDSFGGGTQGK